MKTTTDIKRIRTLWINSQLQNTGFFCCLFLFFASHHHYPVHMDELMEIFLILWCDGCAQLFCIWFVFHLAVTTAEIHLPSPHWWLVSMNTQQTSMNISRCNFFPHGVIHWYTLLHTPLHVRHHVARLPLCCHLSHDNKCNGILVQPLLLSHQRLSLQWLFISQQSKIGSITFGATFVH